MGLLVPTWRGHRPLADARRDAGTSTASTGHMLFGVPAAGNMAPRLAARSRHAATAYAARALVRVFFFGGGLQLLPNILFVLQLLSERRAQTGRTDLSPNDQTLMLFSCFQTAQPMQ